MATLPSHITTKQQESYALRHGKVAVQTIDPEGNAFQAVKTTITTSPTQIVMPSQTGSFMIRHVESGVTIWIGDNDSITAGGDDVFPLLENDIIYIDLKGAEANEIYGIVSASTAPIYAGGVVKL